MCAGSATQAMITGVIRNTLIVSLTHHEGQSRHKLSTLRTPIQMQAPLPTPELSSDPHALHSRNRITVRG